jgi:hypothetical protein
MFPRLVLSEDKSFAVVEYEAIELPPQSLLKEGRLDCYDENLAKDYLRIEFRGKKLVLKPEDFVGRIPINPKRHHRCSTTRSNPIPKSECCR